MHGKGIYRAGEATYDGYFVEDKRHGKGHMTTANGEEYDGDWENGILKHMEIHCFVLFFLYVEDM